MRVLKFDINQPHFIRISIFVSADLRFNSNEKPVVVTNLIEDPRVIYFMSQMKWALPLMFSMGTPFQARESLLLSRLSPMVKTWPFGT